MNPKQLSSVEAKDRTLKALERIPFLSLGTFGLNEHPNIRALVVAAKDGTESIWFVTYVDSPKIAEIKANPKAVLYGCELEPLTEIRLFGKVELLTDSASRQRIWCDEMLKYYPDGIDSPSMMILRFDTESGVYNCYDQETGKF